METSLHKLLYRIGIFHPFRSFKYQKKLVTILCLHRINNDESATFPPFKVKDFERLLQYLSRHYQVVTIERLSQINNNSKPAIILSFDDGFLGFYENALPLLKKYNMPCNLNVVTRCLDNNFQIWTQRLNNLFDKICTEKYCCAFALDNKKIIIDNFSRKNILQKSLQVYQFLLKKDEAFVENFLTEAANEMPFSIPITPMMNWQHLLDALQNYDIELGSHSSSHITLPNIRQKEKLADELQSSKRIIEERTGRKVNIFALPNGSYNHEILQLCADANYKYVLTADEKLFSKNKIPKIKLPRLVIAGEDFYENLLRVENFHNTIKNILSKLQFGNS